MVVRMVVVVVLWLGRQVRRLAVRQIKLHHGIARWARKTDQPEDKKENRPDERIDADM
jgi:hypothetical protein